MSKFSSGLSIALRGARPQCFGSRGHPDGREGDVLRTQVAITGAGPAGLFLGHLLKRAGVDAVILERRDRAYVEGRVRAGVLEPVTVDLIDRLGLGDRMRRQGLVHSGVKVSSDDDVFRVDLSGLTGGSTVMVYGQQEVMKDLFDAADDRGVKIVFEAAQVGLHEIGGIHPFVTWRQHGQDFRLDCDFIVGCDGHHGVSRAAMPTDVLKTFERAYPFGWLGVLAEEPPCDDELIYANHERGFALASMRSQTRSRYYIQCPLDDPIEAWGDERFWDELCARLGGEAAARVSRGPSLEKSIAPLRSFVAEPMRHGRLFLAGDAAHIVPPTGAKGLNLAVSDVVMLSDALIERYHERSDAGIDGYSARALARVWKASRFSWWLTSLTHRFPDRDGFDRNVQVAELAYIKQSRAAQTTFAENYIGLPF